MGLGLFVLGRALRSSPHEDTNENSQTFNAVLSICAIAACVPAFIATLIAIVVDAVRTHSFSSQLIADNMFGTPAIYTWLITFGLALLACMIISIVEWWMSIPSRKR